MFYTLNKLVSLADLPFFFDKSRYILFVMLHNFMVQVYIKILIIMEYD
jgi:hypothetical protein